MPMIQCEAGLHFYNQEQFDKCPSCFDVKAKNTGDKKNNHPPASGNSPKTALIQNESMKNDSPQQVPTVRTEELRRDTAPLTPDKTVLTERSKTRTITSGDTTTTNTDLPVVGWVIITEGAGKGKDFRLIQGENKIGRNKTMEVCLDFGNQSDDTVSRDSHAVIIYDNHENIFYIERGNSRNLPRVNGSSVRRDLDLQSGDTIEIGNTTLRFQALCGEQFQW